LQGLQPDSFIADLNGEVDLKGIEINMEFVRATGKIDKESAPADMVDFALLREARKELGW